MQASGLALILILLACALAENKRPPRKIGKNVLDYTDADLEILSEQWELDDDPLEPDELPEHLRPSQPIDMSKLDLSDRDGVLRASKKGKSLMMFVDVKEELSETEAANILSIWQTSLQNNHIIAERYPIEPKRAIFMFRDGSQAVDAKNFIVDQPECSHVTLEGQHHIGRFATDTIKEKLEKWYPDKDEQNKKKHEDL